MSNNTPLPDNGAGTAGDGVTAARWNHVHPATPTTPGQASTVPYTCLSGVSLLQAVYLSAADTVAAANATNSSKAPCVGFVLSKPDSTHAIVQYAGPMTGFGGLTPEATYYLDVNNGLITSDVSLFPSGAIVQRIGYAEDATTLFVNITREYTVL